MTARELLELKQKEEGLNGDDFAARLGISAGAWSLIASGERRIGWKVLVALKELYPDIYLVAVNERLAEAVA